MLAVIDTNILVSALWSKGGAPARLVSLVLSGEIKPCYDWRIMEEYRTVLARPKFHFTESETNDLLDFIEDTGFCIIAPAISVPFTDEADRKFYEVAKHCNSFLVSGTVITFPPDQCVISVTDFLSRFFE